MPALAAVREIRRRRLGVDRLRPWDLRVPICHVHAPHRPETLLDGCQEVLSSVHPQFGAALEEVRADRLFSVDRGDKKAPSRGYTVSLEVDRKIFLFVHATGTGDDVRTVFHEAGHVVHHRMHRDLPLIEYRQPPPYELWELFSVATEWLASDFLSSCYLLREAERTLELVVNASVGDAFQHAVHSDPYMTPSGRRRLWLELWRRHNPNVDPSGWEDAISRWWYTVGHFFEEPFYYVDYAIASLAAFEIWRRSRGGRESALNRLLSAMRLGGSRPAPDVYREAGATWMIWKDRGALRELVGGLVDVFHDAYGGACR